MLSKKDKKQIAEKGISEEKLEEEFNQFKTGFPFLKLEGPAAVGKGIYVPTDEERDKYIKTWQETKATAS